MPLHRVLLLIVAAALAGCRPSSDRPEPQRTILPVACAPVTIQDSFSYSCTYYGRVEAARDASLSFELTGKLADVFVEEGGQVVKGQLLAKLDTSALEADRQVLVTKRQVENSLLARLQRGEREEVIAIARAEVKRIQVDVRLKEADRQRAETVYRGRAISKSDYDDAVYAHESAKFALEQAMKRLEELESGSRIEDVEAQTSRVAEIDAQLQRLAVQFEKSELRAPFDSLCVERHQDEGVTLAPGQIVLRVSEVSHLEARLSIPQGDLQTLQSVRFLEIEGEKVEVDGFRVISQVDQAMRSVDVVFPIHSSGQTPILPGQTCTLRIRKCIPARCTTLPVTALVPSVRGLWSCYRLQPEPDSDGYFRVEKVEVTIIHTDGKSVVVESSLADRDLVIPTGVHKVAPGMLVEFTESDT